MQTWIRRKSEFHACKCFIQVRKKSMTCNFTNSRESMSKRQVCLLWMDTKAVTIIACMICVFTQKEHGTNQTTITAIKTRVTDNMDVLFVVSHILCGMLHLGRSKRLILHSLLNLYSYFVICVLVLKVNFHFSSLLTY